MTYMLIAAALFLGCSAASFVGLNELGIALFPIPVAVYLARKRVHFALGLVACAMLSAALSGGTVSGWLFYGLVAAVGIPLGLGIARHWTYGWTVTAAAAIACLATIGHIVVNWEEWKAGSRAVYDAFITQQLTSQSAGSATAESMVQFLKAAQAHWPEVGLGVLAWFVLLEVCVALSVTSAWMRRQFGPNGLRGSFREMRPSEWLVWGAIATAVLWYIDSRWSLPALRVISWNTAIGLAAIYWLNGLSILAYAIGALRPHAAAYIALMLLLVPFWFYMLCFVGLFDTWANFRRVLDGVVETRKRLAQKRLDDHEDDEDQ